ncbi:MAG: hypothetical protein RIA69_15105 [Cyclobacteriaceae bacterium]
MILCLVATEYFLRSIPNNYSYKNDYLNTNAQNIEHLFLGSSHAFYGVDPTYIDGVAFNASHVSQSIDYDFAIFDKYRQQFLHLKTVIIPADYGIFFGRTSVGVESWRVKNYELYYDINRSYKLKNHFELLNFRFAKNLKLALSHVIDKDTSLITCTELGYALESKENENLILSGQKAAHRHSNIDQKYHEDNIAIIERFVEYTKKHHIKILFYTSPAYYSYVDNLDQKELMETQSFFSNIAQINSHCNYYSFLKDADFNATDFSDADHLNDLGAKKLSKKLNTLIQKHTRE